MNTFELNPGEEDERKRKSEDLQRKLEATLQNAKTAEFDQNEAKKDQLQDLIEEAKGVPIQVQRMSQQDAQAIRESQERQESVVIQQRRKIGAFMGWISTTIGGIFQKKEKRTTQCDNYGHVAPAQWGEGFPKCVKCGTEITSKDMLRGSSAR
jgi:hypothetical protein